MNKEQFVELLEKAVTDEYGNLYYVDNSIGIGNRVYFATVTTICDDFVKTYCYENETGCGRYDRHFTKNDDTIEILIVKEQ